MNFYIIIGLLVFALGGLMVYSFSIIVGIMLNALGTGIIVYGQQVKSKGDSAEVSRVLQDKIDNVVRRIDEVREGEKNEASDGKIGQIEQEFKDWAAEFLKNREIRKVELARSELDSVDNQLKVSNEWKPIYEYVLKTIESLVQAYNAESGETIKVNFPPLPPNLFSEEAINYVGKIAFLNKVVWHIKFSSSNNPPRKGDAPWMIIGFSMEGEPFKYNSHLMISRLGGNMLNINLDGPNVPTAEGVEGYFPIDSYRDSLKTIMFHLFEAQLLRD